IPLPPLRERREDIPLLIYYFLSQAAERYKKPVPRIMPQTQQLLMSFSWPGNVRQLKNVIENMLVMSTGEELGPESMPREIRPQPGEPTAGMQNLVGISMEQAERELIRNTLKLVNGNREQAAKILEIGERTLYRKIKEFGLTE